MKKITSVVLALCLMLSCFAVCGYATFAATQDDSSVGASGSSQYAQDTIQGGAVLHCFNWSYNNIKNNLQDIYNAGYTAVQVSPVQTPKDYNSSYTDMSKNWWKMYQPLNFSIAPSNGSWLGGATELTQLCTAADSYGIKVIVDVVANHLAEDGTHTGIYSGVDSNLRSNSAYWHTGQSYPINYSNRYSVTHDSMGMPDLNTGNSDIQGYVLGLLKTCVDCGVDGFRFDAAKHIEVPGDSSGASDFWPTVINGINSYKSGLYNYGEILGDALVDISNYTQYMAITEDGVGTDVRNSATSSESGAADGMKVSSYYKTNSASKSVLWVESHDNYLNDGTASISSTVINRAWAMIGSRNSSTALYLARPNSTMGAASSDTSWKATAVKEVNKFKNFFNGTSEYLSSYYRVAYNIRNGQGVVISNLDGAGSVAIPNPSGTMASGTYTDQVSGNTFTVTSDWIRGTTDSSGVAVVYNPSAKLAEATLSSDYYIVGYINGADTGFDSQWNQPTAYKLTRSSDNTKATLTTSFTSDSYIYLKSTDYSSWYMLPEYVDGTSATFYTASDSVSEKMKVPGNVSVTFTLTANTDGSLNLSYTTGGTQTATTTPATTVAPTTTAEKTLSKTYYMIGYINGADYGCEADYANMGTYKFAAGSNGTLTTSFSKESYVFIKQENNANWYMLSAYNAGSNTGGSATYKNTNTGTSEKMRVPANITFKFTLVENNDGTLTLSYAVPTQETTAAPQPTTAVPTTIAPTTAVPTTVHYDETYYLMGNFKDASNPDDWSKSFQLSASGTNTVSATAELAAGTYSFKINEISANIWYGNNGTIENTTETTSPGLGWEMDASADNCTLEATGGTYTFTFNTSTKYLIITYVGGDTEKEYCLFGYIDGADYGKNDDWETIGDYVFDSNGKLTAEFSETSYVAVKTTDNAEWYMLAESGTSTSETFHLSVYGDETYSKDMRVPAGEIEFTLVENSDGTLTLSYTVISEPTEPPTTVAPTTVAPTTAAPTTVAPTTEPAEQYTYTAVGSSTNIFGVAWDSTAVANKMTKNGSVYSITYKNVAPEKGIGLKVVKSDGENQTWYGDSSGNNIEFKVTQTCDVTITFNPSTNEVSVTGNYASIVTELEFETMRAVGNGSGTWLNGASWSLTSDDNMLASIARDLYTITFDDVPAGTEYEFKFAADGSWTVSFGNVKGLENFNLVSNTVYDADFDGDNIPFAVPYELASVTLTLDLRDFDYSTKSGAKYSVKITDTTPEPTTAAPTTVAPTTIPPTTVPVTTVPVTTAPVTTVPVTTVPVTTAPVTTVPVTTVPVTTAPVTTVPVTTAPVTTEPVTTTPPATEPDGLHRMDLSHSLALDGKVGVFFNYKLTDEILNSSSVYVKFTCAGETTDFPLEEATLNSSGRYRFKLYVTAAQMTDTITAQLYVNNEPYSTVDTYSVKTYADAVISSTSPAFDSVRPLVKAMLDYGGKTQLQFNYNTDNLANADLIASGYVADELTDEQISSIIDTKAVETNKAYVGIESFSNMTLVLDSDTTARLMFNVSDVDKFLRSSFSYTKGSDTTAHSVETPTQMNDGRYVVRIPNIASADLGKTFVLEIRYQRFQYKVTFSPLTYVKKAQTTAGVSQSLKDVTAALYNYNKYAVDYFKD